jgi:hypothetical protein
MSPSTRFAPSGTWAELLREMVKVGNPQLLHDATISLAALGIERTASRRWQAIASLAHAIFEGYFIDTKDTGRELTAAENVQR